MLEKRGCLRFPAPHAAQSHPGVKHIFLEPPVCTGLDSSHSYCPCSRTFTARRGAFSFIESDRRPQFPGDGGGYCGVGGALASITATGCPIPGVWGRMARSLRDPFCSPSSGHIRSSQSLRLVDVFQRLYLLKSKCYWLLKSTSFFHGVWCKFSSLAISI